MRICASKLGFFVPMHHFQPGRFIRKPLWLLLAVVLAVHGCDKNRLSSVDSAVGTPSIHSLRINPDSVNIDSLPPVSGIYSITSRVEAQVTDPDGLLDITTVAAQLVGPNSTSPLVHVSLKDDGIAPDSATGDGLFTGLIQVGVTRSQIGRYRIVVTAIDRSGAQSNVMEKSQFLWKNNSPPSLFPFPTIHQFSPSGADSVQLTLSIAATDSDGLEDISRVSASVLNSSDSSARQLFDDGLSTHGDLFPGDGVFSSVFWTRPLAGLQNLTIIFVANDNQGAMSDSVRKTLTNSRPQILHVTVPDSIQRPSTDTVFIPFFLAARDSDGLGDIDSVFFTNLSSINPTNFLMYDDGLPVHGDVTIGDGIYSRIVSIDPTTTLGIKNFQFNVKDRFGEKDSLRRPITIY